MNRMRTRRWRGDQRGAGTVLALSVLFVLSTAAVATCGAAALAAQQHRAWQAAAAAAVAAADASRGLTPGAPCQIATQVAGANGAGVEECRATEAGMLVSARVGTGALAAVGRAHAGAPEAR